MVLLKSKSAELCWAQRRLTLPCRRRTFYPHKDVHVDGLKYKLGLLMKL